MKRRLKLRKRFWYGQMELIYYWMTGTNHKTIDEPQGFNLSPEYDFKVTYNGKCYCLEENLEWNAHRSVFKDGSIINISALVGQNGAGKTIILQSILRQAEELYDYNGQGIHDGGILPYPNAGMTKSGEPIRYIMYIMVFTECRTYFKNNTQKVIFHIYTSLPVLEYDKIQRENIIIHWIGGRTITDLYEKKEFPFQDTSVIYLTNSYYLQYSRVISSYKGIHSLAVSPKTIQDISKKYYETLFEVTEAYPYKRMNNPYLTLEWILYTQRREDNFQLYIDILHYHRILKNRRFEKKKYKSPNNFSVHILSIPGMLMEFIQKVDLKETPITPGLKCVMVSVLEMDKSWKLFLPERDLFTRIVYINLLLEVILRFMVNKGGRIEQDIVNYACYKLSNGMYTISNGEDKTVFFKENDKEAPQIGTNHKYHFWPFQGGVKSVKYVKTWIKEILNLHQNKDGCANSVKYIEEALREAELLIKTTQNMREKNKDQWQVLIEDCDAKIVHDNFFKILNGMNFSMDYIYDETQTVDGVTGGKEYLSMLDLINGFSKNKHSFVLKYLQLHGSGMSSGERALLNFYSWLSEVPGLMEKLDMVNVDTQSDTVKSNEESMLKENMLFLVDEPDLYMHPQWQKNLVKDLIGALKEQYSDKKIQILMTTSSPLTLSDVPVENTVYIKYNRESGKRIFDVHQQKQCDQTFGADIYKLFANSFFLSGSPMGEFAEDYINTEILDHLNSIRMEIWEKEIVAARNGIQVKDAKIMKDYSCRLSGIKWKIEMLANTALYKKATEIYDFIMEWCKE